MRTLVIMSTVLSLLVTGYCFFEYQMPHAQFSKVLNDLKQAGVNDPELVRRVRWSIIGAQTTWKPLLVMTCVQNILLLVVTFYACTRKRNANGMA